MFAYALADDGDLYLSFHIYIYLICMYKFYSVVVLFITCILYPCPKFKHHLYTDIME